MADQASTEHTASETDGLVTGLRTAANLAAALAATGMSDGEIALVLVDNLYALCAAALAQVGVSDA